MLERVFVLPPGAIVLLLAESLLPVLQLFLVLLLLEGRDVLQSTLLLEIVALRRKQRDAKTCP